MRIVEAIFIVYQVLNALPSFLRSLGECLEFTDDAFKLTCFQLVAAGFSPLLAELILLPKNGLGRIGNGSFGMVQVYNLNSMGELFLGDIPDPFGSIPNNDLSFCLIRTRDSYPTAYRTLRSRAS
ncbi:MAG TPA: hypothetical protein P5244_09455 [Syntrophales bacterium]|nr:hypothetical protein [Syntrophales bacterium]